MYKFKPISEPVNLKESLQHLKKTTFSESNSRIDIDSMIVWSGNRLPKVFWEGWKPELKDQGITWQKFTNLLKYQKWNMIKWYQGDIEWKQLVKEVKDVIEKNTDK